MSRVYFFTYGCKLNQYYTDLLRSIVLREGFSETQSVEEADYIVINSCVVTHKAERDVKKAINRALRLRKRGAKVIITGCRSVLPEKRVDFSGNYRDVIRFLGIRNFSEILENSSKSRPFVRIQEGCSLKCSFCIVPKERGPSKSRPLNLILREIETLLDRGYREIVLTGTQLGDWGREWNMNITHLLEKILQISDDFRIRISSISPHRISRDFIELLEGEIPRITPHLHIPLQSGSEKILRDMRRPYTLKGYIGVVEEILERIPDIAIGTDIIAGFPTETEEDFKKTMSVVERVPFAYFHVFEFSPRRGTEASKLTPVHSVEDRRRWVRELIRIGKDKKIQYRKRFVGKILEVLIESERNGFYSGTSGNYLRVLLRSEGNILNQFVMARIEEIGEDFVIGEIQSQRRTETPSL
jgi:threonylcarbamoyladenosine tRNA methylthiotransferase MtaB